MKIDIQRELMILLSRLFKDEGLISLSYWDPTMNDGNGGEFVALTWLGE